MNRLEFFFAAGRLFSPFYAAAMWLRARLYRRGIFTRHTVSVPVLSVGNLSWGGTGKTPLVVRIARYACELGLKPAVVSRGYGGRATEPVNVVSDGRTLLLSAEMAGDEPRFMAESLPGVPVVTGRKRILPARFAAESLGADLIILDDGFQHLALERQLDVVLFRSDHPLGNGRVFPAGPLREPYSALLRAGCFVLTGEAPANDEAASLPFVADLQHNFPGRPVFHCRFEIDRVALVAEKMAEKEPSFLATRKIWAFCGIGNPDSFRDSLGQIGVNPAGFKVFRDHHRYDQTDIDALGEACRESGCELVVTTEKDHVKVRHLKWSVPLAIVRGRAAVDDAFFPFLQQHFFSLCRKKTDQERKPHQ